jgi:hypothetical protein
MSCVRSEVFNGSSERAAQLYSFRTEMNMNTRSIALVVVLLLAPTALQAQMTLGEGVTISFASVAEGKRLLTSRDDFVERMSPFDRAARLKTDKDVSEHKYLEFVGPKRARME